MVDKGEKFRVKKFIFPILVFLLFIGLGAFAGYEVYENRTLKTTISNLEQSTSESQQVMINKNEDLIKQNQDLIKQNQEFQQRSNNFSSTQNVLEIQVHDLEEALKQELNSANSLAYKRALLVLEALATQNLTKINEYMENKPIGIYLDDSKQSNGLKMFNPNGEIEMQLFSWVSRNYISKPEYSVPQGHGVLNQAYGAYHNIVLTLKEGYLWVQFDNNAQLVKLLISREMPVPE